MGLPYHSPCPLEHRIHSLEGHMGRNEAHNKGHEEEVGPLGAFAKGLLAFSAQELNLISPLCLRRRAVVLGRPQQAMLTVQTSLLILLLL